MVQERNLECHWGTRVFKKTEEWRLLLHLSFALGVSPEKFILSQYPFTKHKYVHIRLQTDNLEKAVFCNIKKDVGMHAEEENDDAANFHNFSFPFFSSFYCNVHGKRIFFFFLVSELWSLSSSSSYSSSKPFRTHKHIHIPKNAILLPEHGLVIIGKKGMMKPKNCSLPLLCWRRKRVFEFVYCITM